MRTALITIVSAILFLLPSCTKDNTRELLEGKWAGSLYDIGHERIPCIVEISFLSAKRSYDVEVDLLNGFILGYVCHLEGMRIVLDSEYDKGGSSEYSHPLDGATITTLDEKNLVVILNDDDKTEIRFRKE